MKSRAFYPAQAVLAVCLGVLVGVQPPALRGQSQPVIPRPEVVPSPMPKPATPDGAVRLPHDRLYVINSPVDAVPRLHPAGLVKITPLKGPILVRGKFAGAGAGAVETREFKGPFVWEVEAVGTGRVYLDLIPKGFKDEKEIVHGLIDAGYDDGPPPPKPPDPGPPEPSPKPAGAVRVIMVFESEDTLTRGQRAVVYGKEVEDWMTTNCKEGKNGWRRRDKDSPGDADPTMAALWAAVKPKITRTPCVAVERDGKVELIDLGETPAKMVEILNKYKGGA